MNILFSNESAHADISGASGKGKTFLAKQIIANHPHITNVFVFSKNHQDWNDPKDTLDDIQNTWNLYSRINKKKLVQECIVVFDDFNNESGVNMWRNNTIRQMFTEGRKYGVYCILIHHSQKDSGNIALENCHYKIVFPKPDTQELHYLTSTSMTLNPEEIRDKYLEASRNNRAYLLLKGRTDLTIQMPNTILPVNEAYVMNHRVVPEVIQHMPTENMHGQQGGISSNVQNNGQVVNSTINMQANSIHNHLMQTNVINQNIEINNVYHTRNIVKLSSGLQIKDIMRKHFISADDRDILIANLNDYGRKGNAITMDNYKRAALAFCRSKWPEEEFRAPDDSTRDTLNVGRHIINGDTNSMMTTVYNSLQPQIINLKRNKKIKSITDTISDNLFSFFG